MDFVEQNFKRQTTYREYTLQFLCDGDGKLPERFEDRIAAREAQIAAKMQPGDELWEYEHGDWNAFAAVAGPARRRRPCPRRAGRPMLAAPRELDTIPSTDQTRIDCCD